MKKFILMFVMLFLLYPFQIHAADNTCHLIARGSADHSGTTGKEYANHYMDAYNNCLEYTKLQEEEGQEEILD